MNLLILYFFLAIGVSFLCSILESVLLSVTLSYISVLEKNNKKAGKNLRVIKTDINKSIASILILNTIANTLGAAGVGAQAEKVFGGEWVFYFSIFLTFMILFLSEIIPKTIGALYWKELAPIAGFIIKFCIFITYPIIVVTQLVTNFISKNRDGANVITREELIESTLLSEDEGVIDEQESDIIENVLSLDYIKVNEILTPRSVVYAVDLNTTIKEILTQEEVYKFSRIPIYDKSIDNIIGFVLSKHIFEKALSSQDTIVDELRSDIFTLNENIPVSKALDLFIKKKEHIFLVQDGFAQTEGILTLEDCIETLLGVEIMDECDTTEDMQQLAKERMKEKRRKMKKRRNMTT